MSPPRAVRAALLVLLLAGCATAPVQEAATPNFVDVIIAGSQEDLAANVGDRVFFDLDRADLAGRGPKTVDNVATLTRQAGWLTQFAGKNVMLAGNCDERGTTEYNLALGQRRANTMRNYLLGKGIAGSRVATISYGKERPTAPGSNEEAWAQNRNAIMTVR
jgi:peptidoglycan-associated lipoprotein